MYTSAAVMVRGIISINLKYVVGLPIVRIAGIEDANIRDNDRGS